MKKKKTKKTALPDPPKFAPKHQYNLKITKELIEGIDKHVDGIRYVSRAHIINIAIADWLKTQEE